MWFMKSINCSKPGYCSKRENIPGIIQFLQQNITGLFGYFIGTKI
jgi:hypothetical protein